MSALHDEAPVRDEPLHDAPMRRKGSFAGTLKAVAWSFFGVRKGQDYERDVAQLNPVHLVIAGVVCALLFVALLLLLVNWVIASAVAT